MPVLGFKRQTNMDRLLQKCRRRDDAAWSILINGFWRLVYSVPKRLGLPDADCEDVCQATFVALHRNLDRIESAQALPKWLSVTACREAVRHQRIIGRKVDPPSLQTSDLDELVASEEQTAEQLALETLAAYELRLRIQGLDGRCKNLLEALFLEDNEASYAEVSRRAEMPIGSIGPTRKRCLSKLKKVLEDSGFFS